MIDDSGSGGVEARKYSSNDDFQYYDCKALQGSQC